MFFFLFIQIVVCYSCGMVGHISKNCDSKERGGGRGGFRGGGGGGACYNCGKTGHLKRDCPEGTDDREIICYK